MRQYFIGTHRGMLVPGFPPLYLGPGKIKKSPNVSAESSIGEGIAAWIAQEHYDCDKILARPNHLFPDLILRDIKNITYFVEAKGTGVSSQQAEEMIKSEVGNMAKMVWGCSLLGTPVHGLLIATHIQSLSRFNCSVIEVNL